ncbi:MAG: T9SS type A sorting domain-containing protein [Bacteroidetes bacterium]|nr:T9SS type A sorting domain-containing protein [Bacteroidota bacterium]
MKTLATLLLLILASPSFAQITITYDQFVSAFVTGGGAARTSEQTATSLSAAPGLIALSGAAKTWDFTTTSYTSNTQAANSQIFAFPGSAPLANDADFSTSTHVIKQYPSTPGDPIMYIYFRLDQTGMYTLGVVSDSMGVVTKQFAYQNGGLQEYAFPLTYQTHWSSTVNGWAPQLPQGATITFTEDATCDGYGSLTTPTSIHGKTPILSKTNDCLRLAKTLTTKIDFMGFGTTVVTKRYDWYTTGGSSAEITLDRNDAPQSMVYNSIPGGTDAVDFNTEDPYEIQLGNNPAALSSSLNFQSPADMNARVSISDVMGRAISVPFNGMAHAGSNEVPINVGNLANGTYYVHVEAQGLNTTRKLIVSH